MTIRNFTSIKKFQKLGIETKLENF